MPAIVPLRPVDYVIVGHLACDLIPQGYRLGGTAAYSALTAQALGLRVGVVTAFGGEIPIDLPGDILIHNIGAEHSTTFENVYSHENRIQYIHNIAPDLMPMHVPDDWLHAPIFHIGPIAQEAKNLVASGIGGSILGLTPQGWLRSWNGDKQIHPSPWLEASEMLPKAGAVVISVDDVGRDEEQIESMASQTRILAVTEGPAGSRLYWNGDQRRFHAHEMKELDATGAGDIFAAAFFWRLYTTRDPWTAARFATHLASFSVIREGLQGIPTQDEIQSCLVEVL